MLAASMATLAAASGAVRGVPPFKQAGAPIPQRVEDLLARMTLEEKVAQVSSAAGHC